MAPVKGATEPRCVSSRKPRRLRQASSRFAPILRLLSGAVQQRRVRLAQGGDVEVDDVVHGSARDTSERSRHDGAEVLAARRLAHVQLGEAAFIRRGVRARPRRRAPTTARTVL